MQLRLFHSINDSNDDSESFQSIKPENIIEHKAFMLTSFTLLKKGFDKMHYTFQTIQNI